MELDEIKKMWQEIDALKEKQQVNESRIKDMLKNEGKTTLAKLIRTVKFYTIATIPLGVLFCLLSYKFFEAGGYYVIVPLTFLLITLFLEPLQISEYHFLKEIDFSSMSVKEVLERILKYENFIQKWRIYGTTGFFIFMGIWFYFYYKLLFGSEIIWGFIIYDAVIYFAGGLILIPFLYKKLYYNNINRIKESLKELREFEEA